MVNRADVARVLSQAVGFARAESGAELGIGGGVSGEWDYDWRTGEWGAPGATTLAYSY